MIVRAGYLVDGEPREDQTEAPTYDAALAALPVREAQRLWLKVER